MKRVLFVDDEPHVLQGLRRMLHPMRQEWSMRFETSGEQALEACRAEPLDVVVSDMKMPGMDGVEILDEVKRLQPHTVRIVLSGEASKANVLRSFGVSHQYLSKPCDPGLLKQTIARAEACRDLLANDSLQGLISQMDSLPVLPKLFEEVVREVQDPNCSLPRVGRIIQQDIGMSAKILQIINSAYFALKHRVTNVERAVSYLGLDTITSLLLGLNVFSQYRGATVPGFHVDSLWEHSLRTAMLAKVLAEHEGFDRQTQDDAYMAAVLHDAGKLVLASNVPERYAEVLRHVSEGAGVSEAETAILGTTHAEVAAYVLQLWGLPDAIVEAVAYHARPAECPQKTAGCLMLVHAASGLAEDLETPRIDPDYLEALGLQDRVETWKETGRRALSGTEVPQ